MTSNERFIGQLEDYLDTIDGETPLPNHVRDAIRAELPSTPQVRPGRGLRRILTMTSNLSAPARVGLVAATFVVSVVAVAAIVGNNASPGPAASPIPSTATIAPSPTASPVPSPTPAPTFTAIHPEVGVPCSPAQTTGYCLAPGTYPLDDADAFPSGITLDVPAGWVAYDSGPGQEVLLADKGRPDAPNGSGWGLTISTLGEINREPCNRTAGTFPAADIKTPEDVAAAMAQWPGFSVTAPEPITLDGATGVRFQLGKTELCSPQALWTSALNTPIDATYAAGGDPGELSRTIRVLDVDGELLLIVTMDFAGPSLGEQSQGVAPDPNRHAEDLVEQQAIVDSIQFLEGQ